MKKYCVELSAFTSYDGNEFDHEPTREELNEFAREFIDCFIEDLTSGYIDIDINCYEEEAEN